MTDDSAPGQLYSDAALDDPETDKLGYREFASGVADTIHNDIPDEEFIVGINGQWGSGKSTIVNFIEEELGEKNDSPTIIRFNPWWFSDEADLIEKYLSQLSASLEDYEALQELRNQIATYARAFSKLPLSSFGVPADKAAAGVAEIAETDPVNINELYDEISDHLSQYDNDIVVIVDDIDRLAPDKIRHMFRVIKSVAAFPNITYVVAFDQAVVTDALEGYEGVENGTEYIRKIIQLPLDVPSPQEGTMHQFLTERLNEILYHSHAEFDEDRWLAVYQNGIRSIINTPREAIRIANAVGTALQGIESEVNFIDVVCIETIRLQEPEVYQNIRNSADALTLQSEEPTFGKSSDKFDDLLEGATSENEENIEQIIQYLFPNVFNTVSAVLDAETYQEDEDYLERNRICDKSKFSIYFRQSIGEAELTDSIFARGISTTNDRDKFVKFLKNQTTYVDPLGRSRAYNFLAEFSDRIEKCQSVEHTLQGLLLIGDELAQNDPPHNQLDLGAEEYIVGIAGRLIASEHYSFRSDITRPAFEQAESPYILVELMKQIEKGNRFGVSPDEDEDTEKLFPDDELRELKEEAADRISAAANDDNLLAAPHLHEVLEWWNEVDSDDRCEKYVKTLLDTEAGLCDLLRGLVETGQVYNLGRSKEVEYIDPAWIEPFISPEEALDRLHDEDQSVSDIFGLLQDGIEIRDSGGDPQSMRDIERMRFG